MNSIGLYIQYILQGACPLNIYCIAFPRCCCKWTDTDGIVFVLLLLSTVAFPFLAPLARVIPNKRRDEMNNFFINCIQKIIRQRDEQPVEEVQYVTELSCKNFCSFIKDGNGMKDSCYLSPFLFSVLDL